jgi:uncharacterized membrane protein YbaN (DUF454 family)
MIVLGTISLALGIVGIVVPGLPTTPFLLLTAGLYVRSSNRLYNKLMAHKILGPYIHNFQKNKGIPLKTKLWSIALMWLMISISCIWCIQSMWVIIIVLAAGIVGTITVGFVVRTVNV